MDIRSSSLLSLALNQAWDEARTRGRHIGETWDVGKTRGTGAVMHCHCGGCWSLISSVAKMMQCTLGCVGTNVGT